MTRYDALLTLFLFFLINGVYYKAVRAQRIPSFINPAVTVEKYWQQHHTNKKKHIQNEVDFFLSFTLPYSITHQSNVVCVSSFQYIRQKYR